MNCIVAVDKNWGIGRQNKLLVSIPADMRFFRDKTLGKAVIMGRNTLESFPGGKPLKNRTNVVITRDRSYLASNAIVVHSVEAALKKLENCNTDDIYVIGGGSIYEQFLPYCDAAYVTKVNMAYEADTFFPNLDELKEWVRVSESEEQTYYDIEYRFAYYEKDGPQRRARLTKTICRLMS